MFPTILLILVFAALFIAVPFLVVTELESTIRRHVNNRSVSRSKP